jgi:hypothetical protein
LPVLLLPSATQPVAQDQLPQRISRHLLVSHSPPEAELPPLALSVGRLADESAAAACWVQQLLPPSLLRSGNCAAEVAAP